MPIIPLLRTILSWLCIGLCSWRLSLALTAAIHDARGEESRATPMDPWMHVRRRFRQWRAELLIGPVVLLVSTVVETARGVSRSLAATFPLAACTFSSEQVAIAVVPFAGVALIAVLLAPRAHGVHPLAICLAVAGILLREGSLRASTAPILDFLHLRAALPGGPPTPILLPMHATAICLAVLSAAVFCWVTAWRKRDGWFLRAE